ncbi:hypothetical protein B0H19DRAFT_1094979 [Mycena capillaripes]|nr:hypothetical protein B0H19DRAFT_1094979 [Mycena capillaripes]
MPPLSPHLPPELTELIVEELHDSPQDLASCNLVCRGWLLCARSHVNIFLTTKRIPRFLDLLQSPKNTLVSTICRLEIWVSRDEPGSQVHLPILQIGHPPLPWLTELELSGRFASYASFVSFMSDLPVLQTLTLDEVQWDDFPDPQLTFPTIELKTLTLDWGPHVPVEDVMFCLHARRLILTFWCLPSPITWLRSMSKYLRHLGDHLQYLQLNCVSYEHIQYVSGLDFSRSLGLRHLRIGEAARLNFLVSSSDVVICPDLERFLASVTLHCQLETLILSVETDYMVNPISWTSFARFAELMDAPQFATLREIRFIVNGSPYCLEGSARRAREHFESIISATLPDRPTRTVVCIDGEDSDDDDLELP